MDNKVDRISLFNLLCVMLSWALMSLLFFMFYAACLNPSHKLLIDVNAYGEMRIEIVLFALIWIMTTVNVIMLWKRAGQPEERKKTTENHPRVELTPEISSSNI